GGVRHRRRAPAAPGQHAGVHGDRLRHLRGPARRRVPGRGRAPGRVLPPGLAADPGRHGRPAVPRPLPGQLRPAPGIGDRGPHRAPAGGTRRRPHRLVVPRPASPPGRCPGPRAAPPGRRRRRVQLRPHPPRLRLTTPARPGTTARLTGSADRRPAASPRQPVQTSFAAAQSAWSLALPSPPSVTTRSSTRALVTSTWTGRPPSEPRSTPLEYTGRPSALTENTTLPCPPASASTPTIAANV